MVSQFYNEPMTLPASLIQILKKGNIPFVDFMHYALYEPGYGYYHSANAKIGSQGDFTTAPELTPLFGRALAKQCEQIFKQMRGSFDMLEFGAGTGQLAIDLLQELEKKQSLPEQYYILELSPHLKALQKTHIQEKIPHLYNRVQWLEKWPEKPLSGVFLANEVLDAMPVHRFMHSGNTLYESMIRLTSETTLEEIFEPCTNERLIRYLDPLLPKSTTPYCSEANLFLEGFIQGAAEKLALGCMIFIDYGFPRHEFYHPDRNQGTLMCHYQHKVHANPLIHVGLQDITAHVDFTAVAEASQKAGLDVSGYTNQASFLLNNGLLDLVQTITDEKQLVQAKQAVKQLIQPQEMGELFKVIALTKGQDFILNGFNLFDKRSTL